MLPSKSVIAEYRLVSLWGALAAGILGLSLAGPARAVDAYRLDAANTHVSFVVQRLGIPWISAHFADVSGAVMLDRDGTSRVEVTVGMGSLDCGEPRWNERLRSPEWLDVERYPEMVFHSSRIGFANGRAIAQGSLTLHGATGPVVLNVSFDDCHANGPCRFAAHGRIRRSDYGLPHGFWSGGDLVEIAIEATVPRAWVARLE